jgi:nucleotide-binding universal stress UspA family protein
MNVQTRPRIMVGIAGEDCDAALGAAAEQARLRDIGVHLVHVVRPLTTRGLETADIARWADDTQRAGRLVASAVRRLCCLLDDDHLPVTTGVWHGAVAPSLAAAGQDAALIVLQHRRTARRARGSLQSVTQDVIAQTDAPVLVVPDDWGPRAREHSRVVTVGLPVSNGATGVLRAALEEAHRLEARLLVVHAHDEQLKGTVVDSSSTASRLHLLQQAVSYVAGERPDVPVEVVVAATPPADALARAAATSMLVVVGRRHSRTGSTTRSRHVVHELLTRCPCPLLVVDPLERQGRETFVAGQRQTSQRRDTFDTSPL